MIHFEQRPREVENSWKFHIFRGANFHVGVVQYFEIAFFWKCFMCTYIRKVIYPVFLRSSYITTAPKLTILTHDFLCCKGAEFGRLN